MYKEIDYDFYLFARLCIDLKLIDKTLEYDLAFEATKEFYKQFVDSEFNDLELPLYDCAVDFIKHELDK